MDFVKSSCISLYLFIIVLRLNPYPTPPSDLQILSINCDEAHLLFYINLNNIFLSCKGIGMVYGTLIRLTLILILRTATGILSIHNFLQLGKLLLLLGLVWYCQLPVYLLWC